MVYDDGVLVSSKTRFGNVHCWGSAVATFVRVRKKCISKTAFCSFSVLPGIELSVPGSLGHHVQIPVTDAIQSFQGQWGHMLTGSDQLTIFYRQTPVARGMGIIVLVAIHPCRMRHATVYAENPGPVKDSNSPASNRRRLHCGLYIGLTARMGYG